MLCSFVKVLVRYWGFGPRKCCLHHLSSDFGEVNGVRFEVLHPGLAALYIDKCCVCVRLEC